jgi:hypothetical protein
VCILQGGTPWTPLSADGPVFDELTTEEISLLRELAQNGGPVAEARLSAEALRTLALRRYVKRLSGFSIVTPEGRKALQAIDRGEQPQHPGPRPAAFPGLLAPKDEGAPAGEAPEASGTTLNATQEDMLRQLALAEAPVPFDDLDGRVVRALEGRELVRRTDGRVEITGAGREFYQSKVRRRRRVRAGWVHAVAAPPADEERPDERTIRARSIREAVDALRRAVGGAENIPIEEMEAPAEDAFRAFMELADRIERGADPRKISRG